MTCELPGSLEGELSVFRLFLLVHSVEAHGLREVKFESDNDLYCCLTIGRWAARSQTRWATGSAATWTDLHWAIAEGGEWPLEGSRLVDKTLKLELWQAYPEPRRDVLLGSGRISLGAALLGCEDSGLLQLTVPLIFDKARQIVSAGHCVLQCELRSAAAGGAVVGRSGWAKTLSQLTQGQDDGAERAALRARAATAEQDAQVCLFALTLCLWRLTSFLVNTVRIIHCSHTTLLQHFNLPKHALFTGSGGTHLSLRTGYRSHRRSRGGRTQEHYRP
jgi:hypothetical protein